MRIHSELPVPGAISGANEGVEIARIWLADGQQHVSISAGIWNDPAAWGLMLADFANHVAGAYEQLGLLSREEALMRIKDAFDAEWSYPTDRVEGSI